MVFLPHINKELQVVREHSDWIVVNKPPNLLVHPTRPDGVLTLIDQVRERYPHETLAIINRLDRETSGLVLISRHSKAASLLGKMTMARQIKKRYLAIVTGKTPAAASIIASLDRLIKHEPSRIHVKQAVIPQTYTATTRLQRIDLRQDAHGRLYSLLELELETGRLHQIRVHLQRINHPVIGDKLYGPDDQCYLDFIEHGWTELLAEKLQHWRQALHAHHVRFLWNNEPMHIEIPLSPDLQDYWNSLT